MVEYGLLKTYSRLHSVECAFGGRKISAPSKHNTVGRSRRLAFTLVELLVVISILSLLMGILLPALSRVRARARNILSTSNQRQIAGGTLLYAADCDERFPPSVATVGFGSTWNWSDPTRLIANKKRSSTISRAMSAYLRNYLPDAEVLFCPNAPQKYEFLQEAWLAGEDWDHPETPFPSDPVTGTYCFYWNYTGYLAGRRTVFQGPSGPASGRNRSKLLITCYLGYDHWRSPDAYGSCEKLPKATVVPETWLLSAYWATQDAAEIPDIPFRAGYTDGHVETVDTQDLIPMRVSISADGTEPYPDDIGPGIFYLPPNALH